ncbi:MAG: hypothetical protein ACYCVZ_08640 [Streptosporangiaceae bacterium]
MDEWMDGWSIEIYMREIVNQVENVRLAAQDINETLTAREQNAATRVTRTFMALQSLLAASSMISKLLLPNPVSLDREGNRLIGEAELQRKRTLERGKTLRKLLLNRNDDTQVLINNSAVRNGFEHFDERLDAFIYKEYQGNRNIVDRIVGPTGAIMINGCEPTHLRGIDTTNLQVSVLDDSVNIQSLVTLVEAIGRNASDWLNLDPPTNRVAFWSVNAKSAL